MTSWTAYQRERVEGREKDVPWFVGDKTAAYDFAKSVGVEIPLIYRLFDKAEDFRDEDFPDNFVVKPKGLHSTQGVMVLKRIGPSRYFDFMKKREWSEQEIRTAQSEWFEKNRFKGNYKLIVEEKLIDDNGDDKIPFDYKLYMFRGVNKLIIQYDRNSIPPTGSWFGDDWSPFDTDLNFDSEWKVLQRGEPKKPACAYALLEAARKISVALPTPFVSVDMYATTRGPVLGELTLAPGGPYYGRQYKFREHFDQELGAAWDVALQQLGRPIGV
ncbi:MAG TPA: ATP-grasp fold amidoligase family protein [Stellaceae bacterium]|jgi:hypothetical protein